MIARNLLLVLHLLLIVSWLGIDVGVFYSSFVLRRPGLSSDARREVRRVMVTLDLAPRISLILMIPSGLGLAYVSGLGFGTLDPGVTVTVLWLIGVIAVIWAIATAWAFRARQIDPPPETLSAFDQLDWWFRALASVGFVGMGLASLAGGEPFAQSWLAWKSTLFGLIIAAGLWIRIAARRYRPALADLLTRGETPERIAAVNRAIRGVYPAVLAVWTGIGVMIALAVFRP